ncbi:Oar protein [Geothrix limicola]|uniref:Oar protein n=1 Tax=Geothrix limicola TaxID=2927978 RepID=A0ABQ5QB80_9BACT|nr:TonB-dependent receptor [Geothrix limicola]GLH72084.1 Oar protein [Geothrix limicola]
MRTTFGALSRVSVLIVMGAALPLLAQGVQTSDVSGLVVDDKGQPVTGARVVLTSPSLQGQRTYMTDATGRFSARLLPPGAYTFQISEAGHQTLTANQRLELGQRYSPRFALQPVGNAIVSVVGTLAQVDKQETSTSSNFRMEEVNNLPTGRSVENMMALAPGVVDSNTVNGYAQVRGAMSSNNRFMLDGQEVSDSLYGNRGISVIDDAIDEIQIITGAISAEYGDVDGGVINAVTKTGGNEFSGVFRSQMSNASWNAVKPFTTSASRALIPNKLNHTDSLSVGGYLIKDKLWFFLSGQQRNTSTFQTIDAGSSVDAGKGYAQGDDDKRLQAKFTYLVNQDHTLSFAYVTHREMVNNNDFLAGELAALEPQLSQDSSWSLNWSANWASNLSMEARIGEKKEALTGGGTIPGVTPVYDYNSGLGYLNGFFNNYDGGDHRDNQSADIKFTMLFEGAGSHQVVFGGNYLKGSHRAQNQQSPTNNIFNVAGWDPNGTLGGTPDGGVPYVYQTYQSSTATAYDNSLGFYINDKWSINDRLSLNLGLRWDRYHAYSEDTSASAGASGWSPRMGGKWDIFGDASWQVTASFSRYNAKPLSAIVNSVSNAGNPTEIDYAYTGPLNGATPGATAKPSDVTNPANWTQPYNYASPQTTRLAANLKAPHTNEYQVSLTHGYKVMGHDAYAKATIVRRDYKDLFDYRSGNDGTFTPPPALGLGDIFVKVWENSNQAKRTYKDLELESGIHMTSWDVSGNVVWSSLKGNYQGESSGVGPSGQGLAYFTSINGTPTYDISHFSPSGPLQGHIPLRIRATADYHFDWSWGKTTLGLIYRFDSGAHDSETRTVTATDVNANLTQISSLTQYRNDARGNIVYPAQAFTDFAVTQDFALFKVAEKSVAFFAKITVLNVFNHQQLRSWRNQWESPNGGNLYDPASWVPVSGNGLPHGSSNFGEARSVLAQAGFKF